MAFVDVFTQARFRFEAFATVCMRAGEGRRQGRVDSFHVFCEVAFLFKTFTTCCAEEGRGDVDGFYVACEVVFLFEAFVTYLAAKDRGWSQMSELNVPNETAFLHKAFIAVCMWA